MTAPILQQSLALYFAMMYSWQLFPETHGTFTNFQGQSPFQNGRIMNFQSFVYEHVACCAKNRTNLMFMLSLLRPDSYFMTIHHYDDATFYSSIIFSIF